MPCYGGRSSARLEPQIVDLAVAGSNPVDHPIFSPLMLFFLPSAVAQNVDPTGLSEFFAGDPFLSVSAQEFSQLVLVADFCRFSLKPNLAIQDLLLKFCFIGCILL